MKKYFPVFLLSMLLSFSLSAKELKIGFVNMKTLLTQAPQVEEINEKLQKRFGDPKKELDALGESIKKMEKDFKRDQLMMTESKLQKSKENIVESVKKYREMEAQLAKELQTVQNQELAVFRDEVRKVLDKIAENEKYDLIFNEGVIHASKTVDITDRLLKKLAESHKKSKN